MATAEAKKAEAIKRMKAFGLMPNVIRDFEKNNTLYYSERTHLGGILYWVRNNPEWEKLIRDFEEERDALVYHATHEYSGIGESLTVLFVSGDEDTWNSDMYDAEHVEEPYGHIVRAEVFMLSYDDANDYGHVPEDVYHEGGTVGMKEKAGGLIRTA